MRWVLDSQGSLIYADRDWSAFTGVEADEALRRMPQVAHPDDTAEIERVLDAARAEQTAFLLIFRMRRGNGDYTWVMAGGTPSLAPVDGTFLGHFGSTRPMAQAPEPPQVTNMIASSGRTHTTEMSLALLDSVASHVTTARSLAKQSHNETIVKLLELCLILIGDLLFKLIDRSRDPAPPTPAGPKPSSR